jgi:aspartate/methionine/tyrosine aminotransferase
VSTKLSEAQGWFPDFDELSKQDLSKVKLMWVNYPHMPTGTLPSDDMFDKLIAFGKQHGILICHDNPYSFILNDEPKSILSVPGAKGYCVGAQFPEQSSKYGWLESWRFGGC